METLSFDELKLMTDEFITRIASSKDFDKDLAHEVVLAGFTSLFQSGKFKVTIEKVIKN